VLNVLLVLGGYVYVGTSDGQLLLYEANQVHTGEGESFSAKLLQRKQLTHGKKVYFFRDGSKILI
jgi:hypothetical protein